MVSCVGKTSEPQIIVFLPGPTTASASGSDLVVGENGIGYQNIFPAIATSSARPTILEPIEVQQQQSVAQQQQHSPMETHQHLNNLDKKSVIENTIKHIHSSSFGEDEPGFEFPIMRNRAASDHRSNELSQKLSEYRIHDSIADDNSMPSGVTPSSGLQVSISTSLLQKEKIGCLYNLSLFVTQIRFPAQTLKILKTA